MKYDNYVQYCCNSNIRTNLQNVIHVRFHSILEYPLQMALTGLLISQLIYPRQKILYTRLKYCLFLPIKSYSKWKLVRSIFVLYAIWFSFLLHGKDESRRYYVRPNCFRFQFFFTLSKVNYRWCPSIFPNISF